MLLGVPEFWPTTANLPPQLVVGHSGLRERLEAKLE